MAQIVLIRNANTTFKNVDDYVGCYNDSRIFSERELAEYTILRVEGFSDIEINEFLETKRPQVKKVFRTTIANQWVDTIEKREAWQDRDEWKLINNPENVPKYPFNFSVITEAEREELSNSVVLRARKIQILDRVVSRLAIDPGAGNDDVISISAIGVRE